MNGFHAISAAPDGNQPRSLAISMITKKQGYKTRKHPRTMFACRERLVAAQLLRAEHYSQEGLQVVGVHCDHTLLTSDILAVCRRGQDRQACLLSGYLCVACVVTDMRCTTCIQTPAKTNIARPRAPKHRSDLGPNLELAVAWALGLWTETDSYCGSKTHANLISTFFRYGFSIHLNYV